MCFDDNSKAIIEDAMDPVAGITKDGKTVRLSQAMKTENMAIGWHPEGVDLATHAADAVAYAIKSIAKDPILVQCPFCQAWQSDGNVKVAVHYQDPWSRKGYLVKCDKCGATGPIGVTAQEAADKWNKRVVENNIRRSLVEAIEEGAEYYEKNRKLAKKVKKLKKQNRELKESLATLMSGEED